MKEKFIGIFLAYVIVAFIASPFIIIPAVLEHHHRDPAWPRSILAARQLNRTRRIAAYYPTSWPQGEYRNCTTDLNYEVLDCSDANAAYDFSAIGSRPVSDPTYSLFTIDVKFSGKTSEQSWTCQNDDNHSLTCKN